MNVTFSGNKLTLKGTSVSVGDTAKNFTALANDLSPKSLNDFEGYKVISVVPSLDTSVCDAQTRRFNQDLSDKDVTVLTISNDLPFAQARWCGASGLDNVITLSDHKDLDFALKYGCLVEELRLLTRAVFVLDGDNKVVYVEYLDEITNHPNYDAVIDFVNQVL